MTSSRLEVMNSSRCGVSMQETGVRHWCPFWPTRPLARLSDGYSMVMTTRLCSLMACTAWQLNWITICHTSSAVRIMTFVGILGNVLQYRRVRRSGRKPAGTADNLWWSDPWAGARHPHEHAIRCLPCSFNASGIKLPFEMAIGCPCTPEMVCSTEGGYLGTVNNVSCGVPRCSSQAEKHASNRGLGSI